MATLLRWYWFDPIDGEVPDEPPPPEAFAELRSLLRHLKDAGYVVTLPCPDCTRRSA